jgi:hypothetical protein
MPQPLAPLEQHLKRIPEGGAQLIHGPACPLLRHRYGTVEEGDLGRLAPSNRCILDKGTCTVL